MLYILLLYVSIAIGFLLLFTTKNLMCAIGTYVNLLYEFPHVVLPTMYRNERKKFWPLWRNEIVIGGICEETSPFGCVWK